MTSYVWISADKCVLPQQDKFVYGIGDNPVQVKAPKYEVRKYDCDYKKNK